MSFALRMLVTVAIILPYFVIRQPQSAVEIFVIACVAFGAGRLVAYAVDRRASAPKPER